MQMATQPKESQIPTLKLPVLGGVPEIWKGVVACHTSPSQSANDQQLESEAELGGRSAMLPDAAGAKQCAKQQVYGTEEEEAGSYQKG